MRLKTVLIANSALNSPDRAENRERFNAFSAIGGAVLKRNCYIFFLLLLILTGCMPNLSPPATEEPHNQPHDDPDEAVIEAIAVTEASTPIPFTVLYAGDEITKAMYEPATGAYLGAWLGQNMSKPDFEAKVKKKHAVFAREINIDDDFPDTWILQSIAAQAAPLIKLRLPDSAEYDFPLAELTMFAYELGKYNLPAFIVFNPLQLNPVISPEDYVLLFRYARIIFRTYAPMAAFVWHANDNMSTPESPYYPGHDVVDWVSISLTAPQGPEGFLTDIPAKLTPFYVNFQRYKPIILLPIGISHFSHRDFVYRVPYAAAEITRVYEAIRDNFPRVRLVVYGDHGQDFTTPQRDDFSITREQGTIYAYHNAISNSHFISRLEPSGEAGPIWMLSALHGYYYEGEIFIDREILISRGLRVSSATTTEINGRLYVEVGAVRGLEVEIDHARQVVFVGG